jgi:hypothetical protein
MLETKELTLETAATIVVVVAAPNEEKPQQQQRPKVPFPPQTATRTNNQPMLPQFA